MGVNSKLLPKTQDSYWLVFLLWKKSKESSLSKMSYLAPSMTAMKYRREPFLGRPLEPGERYSVCREMESCIRGFKEVNRDLTEARRVLDHQKRMSRSASIERVPAASFYKSLSEQDLLKVEEVSTFQKWWAESVPSEIQPQTFPETFRIPKNRKFIEKIQPILLH